MPPPFMAVAAMGNAIEQYTPDDDDFDGPILGIGPHMHGATAQANRRSHGDTGA